MNKALQTDLIDLADIMEGFVKKLPQMSEADQIDLAARLKPVAKACKQIDDAVKDAVKAKLHHKEGNRLGNLFKAVLKVIHTSRLDQTALREERPKIYDLYNKPCDDERVTFELR